MRLALLLATLTLTTACTAVTDRDETVGGQQDVTMSTIARGSNSASRDERNAVLATTDADYQRLWATLIGAGTQAPAVEFEKNVVVFLLAGTRNTGGWSVDPRGVTVSGDTATIDAPVTGPGPDMIVTQALTYPYAVVTVQSRDVRNVRWKE